MEGNNLAIDFVEANDMTCDFPASNSRAQANTSASYTSHAAQNVANIQTPGIDYAETERLRLAALAAGPNQKDNGRE